MWPATREPCDEGLIRAAAAPKQCSKRSARWILAATILASAMAFIDGTVVNVALPALQTDLKASAVDVQWVIEAYALFLSALLLIGGSLGDQYGRRRIFVAGVALFALASAACGFAADVRQLIAARALQGIGAALLVPGSLAIISNSFADKDRGRAIGTWSGASAITAAIGPVMGGWLIQHFSWRTVFFINIPIALVIIGISLVHIPENSDNETTRVDWLGAILAASGLGCLVYGLIEFSRVGSSDSRLLVVLFAAPVLLALFFWVESRTAEPMLPLRLFRSRTFAGANLLTFLLYGALGGALFFLPLNLIQVQHYTPTAAGAALLPFVLLISVLSRWSGALVPRFGARKPLIFGPIICAIGFAVFALPGVGGGYWTNFFPAVVLLGLGMAISVAPLTTTVMSSVSPNHAGIASGVNNAVARSASLIAIAVFGIVMLQVFGIALDKRLTTPAFPPALVELVKAQRIRLAAVELPKDIGPATQQSVRRAIDESFVSGFRTVMLIGSALAAAGALTAFAFISAKTAPETDQKF